MFTHIRKTWFDDIIANPLEVKHYHELKFRLKEVLPQNTPNALVFLDASSLVSNAEMNLTQLAQIDFNLLAKSITDASPERNKILNLCVHGLGSDDLNDIIIQRLKVALHNYNKTAISVQTLNGKAHIWNKDYLSESTLNVLEQYYEEVPNYHEPYLTSSELAKHYGGGKVDQSFVASLGSHLKRISKAHPNLIYMVSRMTRTSQRSGNVMTFFYHIPDSVRTQQILKDITSANS